MLAAAVEALLFDLGGVVYGVDFGRAIAVWSGYSGVSERELESRFVTGDSFARHERGEIGPACYFASLRETLGIRLTDAQFTEGWNDIYLPEVPGIRSLLSRLAPRAPLYSLTNTNRTHQPVWEHRYRDTLGVFRRIFVSSEMGLRKPEAEAYMTVSRSIDVPPRGILFFDDSLENVVGARAVGMQAVHVRSASDVEAAAEELLR